MAAAALDRALALNPNAAHAWVARIQAALEPLQRRKGVPAGIYRPSGGLATPAR
jgi:hypothetical protein